MSNNLNSVSPVFTFGSVSIALPWTHTISMPSSLALGNDHTLFLPLPVLDVAGCMVPVSSDVKILSVTLDSALSLNKHVGLLCKACYYHIRALRHIWKSLADDSAKSIACSIVGSRLDYANSALVWVSASNIKKLQWVQNTLVASLLFNTATPVHANPLQPSTGSQLSGVTSSRSPPSLTNFFQPVNHPTLPAQSLYMPLVAHSGPKTPPHSMFLATS